jgi:hypothetical protein
MSCSVFIIVGVALAFGYALGTAVGSGGIFEWRYKIVHCYLGGFEVWYRPGFWPLWFDQGPIYKSVEDARHGIELFKKRGKAVSC